MPRHLAPVLRQALPAGSRQCGDKSTKASTLTADRAGILLPCLLIPSLAHGEAQSAFEPKGPHAQAIGELTWILFAGGGVIFILVILLALAALFGPPALRALLARRTLVIGGGIVFPLVTLSALLIYSLSTASALVRADEAAALRIHVVGEMWWWRVRYLDARGAVAFETANEIRIPAGREVALSLTSPEVIHSFWVPNLAGKIDTIPGHVNTLRLRADAPGIYRGQCAEYCGTQHARMAFHVIALAPQEFDAWHASQHQPAASPADALARHGRQVFFDNQCATCHTVRGTPAMGASGPDLTHVGSRHTLAAGTLPNRIGAFAGWIAGSQHIKQGNPMPSFGHIPPEDLRALAAYMESLQ